MRAAYLRKYNVHGLVLRLGVHGHAGVRGPRGVFGVDGALNAAKSTRNTGRAYELVQSKAALKQALCLTVAELRFLETYVVDANSLEDKLIAGLFTFMALARARSNDTVHVEEIAFNSDSTGEVQFVEMRTKSFKTAKIVGMEGEVLCLVAPAAGGALERAGLFGRKEPPALRPYTHAKLGQAYRRMLARAGAAPLRVSRLPPNGLKATCVSWAAQAGVEAHVRRTLGYHSRPDEKMVVTYARDHTSAPLR
eukprot:1446671-Amphidinium_carterae.2